MATKKSTAITNRDASPAVLNNPSLEHGDLKEATGYLESETTDSNGDILLICQVPSNARVSQVLMSCDDSGTTGAYNVGVYETTENGGAAVDADLFASAQVATTALSNEDITHESGQYTIEEATQPLWEALGLSEDPNKYYDIGFAQTAAPENDATVALKVRYV